MKALYMDDCYLKEFDATIKKVTDSKFAVLDQTAFYPNSGGQPNDTGVLRKEDGTIVRVVYVGKFSGEISHETEDGKLEAGDKVHGIIDWERRYLLMRYHTAAHILSGIFHKEANAKITGNQLDVDKGRIDFSLEEFDREKINDYFAKSNELTEKDLPIRIYTISREEAEQDEGMFKLAKALPESIKEIRVVEIVGFDRQADGGTHVRSLKEVGKIEFLKAENKGKENRRVYFRLS